MKIQLTKAELDIVKKILSKHLPNATHYLFGSRVRGTAKQYSDLDVVIISDKSIVHDTQDHDLYNGHCSGIDFSGTNRKVLTTRTHGKITIEVPASGQGMIYTNQNY